MKLNCIICDTVTAACIFLCYAAGAHEGTTALEKVGHWTSGLLKPLLGHPGLFSPAFLLTL